MNRNYVYYEVDENLVGVIGRANPKFDTIEEARKYIDKCKTRNENDGYDDFWKTRNYKILKVTVSKEVLK